MTEAREDPDNLVRVRAQVMCRDEATGGWVPLGGGGLSNVMVRRKPRQLQTTQQDKHQQTTPEVVEHQPLGHESSASSINSKHSCSSTSKSCHPTPSPGSYHRPLSANASNGDSHSLEQDNRISSKSNSLQRTSHHKNNNSSQASCIDDGKGNHKQVAPTQEPKFEYFIFGKRISDQAIILSCTIKKDFQYNKVMPTFHHWVTDEKRFGLTFQTAADARAFDKGVRGAIEEMLDDLGGAWPPLRVYKKMHRSTKDDEDNIFECLNLPTDSRSSSENSTASRTQHSRRSAYDDQRPIFNIHPSPNQSQSTAIGRAQFIQACNQLNQLNNGHSTDLNMASKELILKQKLDASSSDDLGKMSSAIGNPLDADNYSYVQLTAVHEYIYPHVGADMMATQGNRSPLSQQTAPGSNTTTHSTKTLLERRESISSVKKHNLGICYSTEAAGMLNTYQTSQPPPLPVKKKNSKKSGGTIDATFKARHKCRYCQDWYFESANKPGICEHAPDMFKSCINGVTMMKCAQCMLYHCMSDSEGDFATNPCECNPREEGFGKRWFGLSLLSLLVPCLCCYPILRGVYSCCACCGVAGGKHAPQR